MSLIVEVSLDEHGRIVFSETARSQLGLLPGMTFVVAPEASGGVRLEPQPEQPHLVEIDGILVVRGELTEDITDIVKRDRELRLAHLIHQADL